MDAAAHSHRFDRSGRQRLSGDQRVDRLSDHIELLRSRLPVEPMIREDFALRAIGTQVRGQCPDHPDETESLHVDCMLYHCFACGRGGDFVRWTMARQDLDEQPAIEHLTRRAGLPPYRPG